MQALADAAVGAQLEEAPLGADEAASSGGPDQPPQPPEPATHSTAGSAAGSLGEDDGGAKKRKRGAVKIESPSATEWSHLKRPFEGPTPLILWFGCVSLLLVHLAYAGA